MFVNNLNFINTFKSTFVIYYVLENSTAFEQPSISHICWIYNKISWKMSTQGKTLNYRLWATFKETNSRAIAKNIKLIYDYPNTGIYNIYIWWHRVWVNSLASKCICLSMVLVRR